MFALVKSNNKAMISVFEQFGFVRSSNSDLQEIELIKYLNTDEKSIETNAARGESK
jgi:hypothetical protein